MPIDKYINELSKLNTDRNFHRWSAAKNQRTPHKPFLLLPIMDLIA